ncbi:hypothetical protein DRJ17_01920 [Candidatus Woesearchaeota archaeon]|nr:MAG: hypothetical protein DRJ17_01920 [Candidatus Woesearchaeota archaeon]
MIDVVMPNNNEAELVNMAKELGYDSLCFLYEKTVKRRKYDIPVYYGILVEGFDEVRRFRKERDLIFVKSGDKDREIIEKSKVDAIFDLEDNKLKDRTHFRSSGLDHVMARFCHEKEKTVVVNFKTLLAAGLLRRAVLIGRIMQNIRLMRKYGFNMTIVSFAKSVKEMRSAHDFHSLLVSLGMHPSEAKKGMGALERIAKKNIFRRSERYIAEGVEYVD